MSGREIVFAKRLRKGTGDRDANICQSASRSRFVLDGVAIKISRDCVPDAILDRRDKIGYAAPERRWLKLLHPWVRKTLGSELARSIPCLNVGTAGEEWSALRDGKRPYDSRIWRCLDLIRWAGDLGVVYD